MDDDEDLLDLGWPDDKTQLPSFYTESLEREFASSIDKQVSRSPDIEGANRLLPEGGSKCQPEVTPADSSMLPVGRAIEDVHLEFGGRKGAVMGDFSNLQNETEIPAEPKKEKTQVKYISPPLKVEVC